MRIALVSQEYPPETAKGGIGTQTYLKAHGLSVRGHEVWVVSQMPRATPGRFIKHSLDGGVHVIRTAGFWERMPIWTEAAGWLTYSAEVAVALAELNAYRRLDLIDFPEWGGEGYVHLLNQKQDNYIPSVIHLHGPIVMFAHALGWPKLDSELYRLGVEMEKTCLRLGDAIFASSKCSAEWCRQHHGLPDGDTPVIHTGIDTTFFRPRSGGKNGRPTVIFVGRIAPNKGVEILLDACSQLHREFPNLQLRMLGEGDASILTRLREKAPPGLLHLSGFTSRNELPDDLSRAHVFAAPSIYEGGPGFVYLEAMACGLPAIGCLGSGVEEVITSGFNGELVPPSDTEALISVLRELLSDESRRETIGRRAREYVVANAEREQCLDRIEAFYKSVMQRGK